METVYLTGKEPLVQDFARAVGYNGKKFQVRVMADDATIDVRSYWDGGSRSTFQFYNLANRQTTAPVPPQHPYFDTPIRGAEAVPLPDGVVCLEHMIFCGKDMGIRIHARKANIAGLLPDRDATERMEAEMAISGLATDMKIVLAATAGLKPSYNGIANLRFYEANRITGITQERWDVAKSACIQAKLLNKAGAITPEGRNVIGWKRLDSFRNENSPRY